ncbi:glycosyltransferase family 39 protein [Hymenobacter sp.]|uniref:glycosyltransferase family 39 protein n=1 Tax=Hymenobacter sp. TaxID=1898978 RepID=UPI00286C231A|nr:glycosyltransferase family 39 protein [Hymenobacter sp.]
MPTFFTAAGQSEEFRNRVCLLAGGSLFLVLTLFFYVPSIGLLPRGIHAWAQSDRLSLAIGFYDNGLHFFRPQTQNLSSIDGVTGVEFPLIPYLAALGAKLTGRDSLVLWYRGLTASTAWLSYYFLFRLVFERTQHFVAALLPGVFLATSPVFAYYAGNFVPDPVGAALTLVASYYLLRYALRQQFRDLGWAIGWFTLASLIKTSAAIYLIAAMSSVVLWTYLQPSVLRLRQKLGFIALCLVSLAVVIGYALYNRYLNELYDSTSFLAQAMPIESEQEYEMVMTRINDVWIKEYFTKAHYFILQASALICLLRLPRIVRTDWLWAIQLFLAAVGGWAFFKLMGRQFADHDYYVLAPYWPGLTLLVALATVQAANWQAASFRWRQFLRLAHHAVFGSALLALLVLALPRYRARMSDSYPPFSNDDTYRWMEGGAAAMNAAEVPATATLLVLGEVAPNLSLVYFDRRGLVWRPDINRMPSAELLDKMADAGLDHLVMRREEFQTLSQAHPDLLPAFTEIVSNSRFVLLKRNDAPGHW